MLYQESFEQFHLNYDVCSRDIRMAQENVFLYQNLLQMKRHLIDNVCSRNVRMAQLNDYLYQKSFANEMTKMK